MADKKEVVIDINVKGNASDKTKQLSTDIKKVKTEAKGTTETFGLMNTQIGKTITGVIDFGRKAVGAFKSIKGAIISTGIGALVLLVISLVSYFTKTEEGANKLKVVFAAVGAVVDSFVSSLQYLAEWLFEGKEAADAAADSYGTYAERVQGAIDVQRRSNQLAKDVRDNLATEATLMVRLSELKTLADDQTKTEIEKLAILKEAKEVQNQISDNGIRLKEEEYELAKKQNSLSSSTAADLDKEAQLKRELILIEAERNNKSKEFDTKASAIHAKRIKEAEDEFIANQKLIDQELNNLNRLADADEEASNKRITATENYNNDIKQLTDEFNNIYYSSELDRIQFGIDDQNRSAIELLNSKKKELDDLYDIEIKASEDLLVAQNIWDSKRFKETISAEKQAILEKIQLSIDGINESILIDGKAAADKVLLDNKKNQDEFDTLQAYYEHIAIIDKKAEEARVDSFVKNGNKVKELKKQQDEITKEEQAVFIEKENEAIEEIYVDREQSEYDHYIALQELKRQYETNTLVGISRFEKKKQDKTEKGIKDEKALRKKAAQDLVGIYGDLLGDLSGLAAEDSDARAALSASSAIIEGLVAGIAAYKGMIIAFPGPVGIATGLAAGLAAAATGFATAKSIRAEHLKAKAESKAESRALGGFIGGPSHQDGGVSVNGEGGEYVVNKRTMANPLLAKSVMDLNSIGNGGMGSSSMLSEDRVAEIAAQVVGQIEFVVIENNITAKQQEVKVREQRFVK